MSRVVLDASAILALLQGEAGADRVEARRRGSMVSAANSCEVLTRLIDRGADPDEALEALNELDIDIVGVTREDAERAARLRLPTRSSGLSLGDRLCLALAARSGNPVLTADRAWSTIDVGLSIEIIR